MNGSQQLSRWLVYKNIVWNKISIFRQGLLIGDGEGGFAGEVGTK